MKSNPVLLGILFLLPLTSCLEEHIEQNRYPRMRNVRLDPGLLSNARLVADSASLAEQENTAGIPGLAYTRKVVVSFKAAIRAGEQAQLLQELPFIKAVGPRIGSDHPPLYSLELTEGLVVEQVLAELQKRPEITYAAPFFLSGTELAAPSGELLVQVKSPENSRQLEQLLRQSGAVVMGQSDALTFRIRVNNKATGSPLALAALLRQHDAVAAVAPVFITAPL